MSREPTVKSTPEGIQRRDAATEALSKLEAVAEALYYRAEVESDAMLFLLHEVIIDQVDALRK